MNRNALVAQRRELNTGLMTLGQWFSTHPPLAKRIAALQPGLSPETKSGVGGTFRALGIVVGVVVVLCAGLYLGAQGGMERLGWLFPSFSSDTANQASTNEENTYTVPATAGADLQAAFDELAQVLDAHIASGGSVPETYDELLTVWSDAKGDVPLPTDPYDGEELGYMKTDSGYRLWSSGPDGESDTADDITYDGPRSDL